MLNIFLFLDSLGGGELLMIMVFILLFFGSSKIPDLAKGLGRGMREFRDAMSGVQREIEDSVREKENRKENQQPANLPPDVKPSPGTEQKDQGTA